MYSTGMEKRSPNSSNRGKRLAKWPILRVDCSTISEGLLLATLRDPEQKRQSPCRSRDTRQDLYSIDIISRMTMICAPLLRDRKSTSQTKVLQKLLQSAKIRPKAEMPSMAKLLR